MNSSENTGVHEIVNKTKEEVRKGIAGKTMTLTDVSIKMTEALNEIKESFMNEIEEVVNSFQATEAVSCPDCGNALKKTEKQDKKK